MAGEHPVRSLDDVIAHKESGNGREDESLSASAMKGKPATMSSMNLDDLKDDLLIEILRRLPTAELAVGLKLVSKRWCSIISTPYFVSQFITHHINQKNSTTTTTSDSPPCYASYRNSPSVFISNYKLHAQLCFVTGPKDQILFDQSRGYPLEFLPDERKSVSILASCNDLLFCGVTRKDFNNNINIRNYCICNPITMESLFLPPAPVRDDDDGTYGYKWKRFGLVCDPRWIQGQKYEALIKVVCLAEIKRNHFTMDIYCSETGKWSDQSSLQLGAEYHTCSNIVSHDGKLYWYNGLSVVAFDPFNINNAQTINVPDGSRPDCGTRSTPTCALSACLGLCEGRLRLMKLVKYFNTDVYDSLNVWELDQNHDPGRLNLKHKVFLKNQKSAVIRDFVDERGPNARALAFHPNDKDVVCLGMIKRIVLCKFQGGEVLEFVGKTSTGSSSYLTNHIYTSVLPWWPSPVSTLLPQTADHL